MVGKGKITSHAELTNRTQASVGRNVQIAAHQDFSLLAKSTNTANSLATGGSGGVVDLSEAATDVSVDDQTTSEVGDGSSIVAGTVLSVVAEMETAAHTHCDVDARGWCRRRQRCHHYFYRFDDDDPWGGCVAS